MVLKLELGKRIKVLRELNKFSQEIFAEKIGINRNSLSKIETGVTYPKPETIEKIKDVLGIEYYELFLFNKSENEQFHDINMKINDSKLYGRVIFGYIIVFFIIACISLIFICQKIKLEDINNKQYQINLVHSKISVLPLYVNKLSSLSESVFTWNYRDYLEYQRNRLFTDSILQDIKIHCNGFIQIEQVDSLCNRVYVN